MTVATPVCYRPLIAIVGSNPIRRCISRISLCLCCPAEIAALRPTDLHPRGPIGLYASSLTTIIHCRYLFIHFPEHGRSAMKTSYAIELLRDLIKETFCICTHHSHSWHD
jgi:hypothetical protein